MVLDAFEYFDVYVHAHGGPIENALRAATGVRQALGTQYHVYLDFNHIEILVNEGTTVEELAAYYFAEIDGRWRTR